MDLHSSEEKFNIKTRKPYTITKQRERWTEDEHNSFIEALKLYGRAWQRIEEHIGTKTAVQIRSHAQKFFTKLEKEAHAKGVPIRQALDMEIPPPRPKKKPNYPYPRKTGAKSHPQLAEKYAKQATEASHMQSGVQILNLERKPLSEINSIEEKLEVAKTSGEIENGTDDTSILQEAACVSENENSIRRSVEAVNQGVFREFIPSLETIHHDEENESYVTSIETSKHQKSNQDGLNHTFTSNTSSHENIIKGQNSDSQPGNFGNEIQGRHVPVQVVANSSFPPERSFQESTLNSRSSSYQTVPTFHPFSTTLFCDNYRSLLHVSSNISSLVVSHLLQNPAAHAAASVAATFWHSAYTEGDSSGRNPPSVQSNSETAIAAATVAAATAWWAAHGLLPACAPLYSGYSCPHPFSFGTPINDYQAREKGHSEEKTPQEHRPSESGDLSEDSDGRENGKANNPTETKEMTPVAEPHDSSKTNVGKQVDRSSCGSNTTSSSEIETDGLEKHGKEEEENKGVGMCTNSSSRRSRSTISPIESWKEVSEEGRLAFEALFSREVLPQSFWDAKKEKKSEGVRELELKWMSCDFAGVRSEKNVEEGVDMKLKGFKPYKRCSVEAKEMKSSSQNDEKGAKRMRVEADT